MQRFYLKHMRRKIHEAFRGKGKAEDDTVSVTSEDSDEIDDALTEKRLTAVRKIKARTSHYCSLEKARKKSQDTKLYEYVVVVSLKFDETQRRYEPCEIRRFPHEVSDSQNDKLRAIPYFCFPDSFKWAPVEDYNSETFSFVLTSFDGSRFYGYNRRLLPPGEGARLPEVFCVMSPVPCYPLYFQLLDEIERRREHSMEEVEVLLKVAYDTILPRPGKNVGISANLNSQLSVKDPLYLQRPQDSRLEQIDFDYLFKNLSIPHVLQIFGSLLLERRIVMFSSYLSKLSKCSQAIAALLYPFAWQHVYVPVLPQKLLDMCCSPTPYIMGMLSLSIPELEDMPLEEVLIVNLDAGEFDVHVGDEDTILPRRLSVGLDKALQTCMRESLTLDFGDAPDKQLTDCETRNKSISEAFILFFVELMGHYLNHFQQSQDGKMVFDRESFIKGTNSKSIRRFLEVFTETQMFSLFIQEKETDSDEGILQSLFDQRIQGYESERRNSKLLGVVNVKKIGQKLAGTAKGVKVKVKAFDDKI